MATRLLHLAIGLFSQQQKVVEQESLEQESLEQQDLKEVLLTLFKEYLDEKKCHNCTMEQIERQKLQELSRHNCAMENIEKDKDKEMRELAKVSY